MMLKTSTEKERETVSCIKTRVSKNKRLMNLPGLWRFGMFHIVPPPDLFLLEVERMGDGDGGIGRERDGGQKNGNLADDSSRV